METRKEKPNHDPYASKDSTMSEEKIYQRINDIDPR